jgi:hypothetical protein
MNEKCVHKNNVFIKKRNKSLNKIQKHFVYNIRYENNNEIYITQNINPYKRFQQYMWKPL